MDEDRIAHDIAMDIYANNLFNNHTYPTTSYEDTPLLRSPRTCKICRKTFASLYAVERCQDHDFMDPLPSANVGYKKIARNNKKLFEIRQRIWKKGGAKCNNCEKVGWELHHIKEAKDYPELLYDEDNIILLCKKCHDKIHPWRVKKAHERRADSIARHYNTRRTFKKPK